MPGDMMTRASAASPPPKMENWDQRLAVCMSSAHEKELWDTGIGQPMVIYRQGLLKAYFGGGRQVVSEAIIELQYAPKVW